MLWKKFNQEFLSYLKCNPGIVLLFFGLTYLNVFSQVYTPLVNDLNLLSKNNLSDQVYIQTSKGIYETGEDLWFKAYVLDNQFFLPSYKARTLYVRLYQEDDSKTVWEEKYEIENGFSEGHIYVNDTLSPGNYILSAFTQNSIFNESEDYLGVRKIRVVQRIGEYVAPLTKRESNLDDFSLLPEGGYLVSELKNRIAFKAIDRLGFPIEVSGTLFEDESPVLEFKSEHAGMGSFDITPKIGKKYHVKLNEHNIDSIFRLPKIENKGILIRSEGQKHGNLNLSVLASSVFKGSKIFVRLQIRGVTYSMAEAKCNDSISIKIPLQHIPQGIAEVTLFDKNLRPMAERLVYVNRNLKLHIQSTLSSDTEYRVRNKVTLKLKVTDTHGNPVQAHLGVSVYDQVYQNVQDDKNIMTHYYLTSQLKGKVYNPNYYFDPDNDGKIRAMNLLLMTQGWRRYVWSETNLKRKKAYRKPLVKDGIEGILRSRKKGAENNMSQPAIIAYNPVSENTKDIILPDSIGKFTVEPSHLKMGKSGYLYLRAMADKKSGRRMELLDNGFEVLRKKKGITYPLYSITDDQIYNQKIFAQDPNLVELEEVQVKSKKRNVYREKYFGKLDSLAKTATTDYVCKYNILNCEYHVNDKQNKKPVEGEIYLYMEVWDENTKSWVKGHKDFMGDVPWRNPPLPPYRYPNYTDAELLELFGIVRVKGYYGRREFYQPNYDVEKESFPDYRNTLFWNPSVVTDKNGNASLEFFCSDINTRFLGNVEGVGGDGLLGRHTFEFLVKK